jgi:hypothetical protein
MITVWFDRAWWQAASAFYVAGSSCDAAPRNGGARSASDQVARPPTIVAGAPSTTASTSAPSDRAAGRAAAATADAADGGGSGDADARRAAAAAGSAPADGQGSGGGGSGAGAREAAAERTSSGGGGADDVGGGADARRAASRPRWRDLVAQLSEMKASNKAAEGEVAKVLEQVGTRSVPAARAAQSVRVADSERVQGP